MNKPVIVKEFRIKLYPNDFASVRNYYEKVLQFPVKHEWDRGKNNKGVMFNVGGTTLELLSPEGGYKPIVGCDLSLEVPDVVTLWEQMKGGDNILHPIRDNAWGDTSFRVTDPEGFAISFFTKQKTSDTA